VCGEVDFEVVQTAHVLSAHDADIGHAPQHQSSLK
jgi:hypothetical protein